MRPFRTARLEPRIPDHPHARPRAPLAHECAFFLQLRDHALSASLQAAETLSELGNRRAPILTEEHEGTGPRSVASTRGLGEREYQVADRLEHELNGSLTRPARAFCTSRMSRGSPSTRCPSGTALTARSSRLFPSIMSEEQIVWILSSRRSAGFVARGACGESTPTSSAISMQSASIASVRSNGGSQAMTTLPLPPLAVMMRRDDRRRASSTPCSRIRPTRRPPPVIRDLQCRSGTAPPVPRARAPRGPWRAQPELRGRGVFHGQALSALRRSLGRTPTSRLNSAENRLGQV